MDACIEASMDRMTTKKSSKNYLDTVIVGFGQADVLGFSYSVS